METAFQIDTFQEDAFQLESLGLDAFQYDTFQFDTFQMEAVSETLPVEQPIIYLPIIGKHIKRLHTQIKYHVKLNTPVVMVYQLKTNIVEKIRFKIELAA